MTKCLYLGERLSISVAIALIVVFGFHATTPASHWLTVQRLDITSAIAGAPIIVDYQRTVARPVKADRTARLDRWNGERWAEVCDRTARRDYRPDEEVDRPVYLSRFLPPECATPAAGDYRLTIEWNLNPTGIRKLIFGRTAEISERFAVVEAPK